MPRPLPPGILGAPTGIGSQAGIASPFQFATTGEERLRVTSFNALTGVRVAIQGRRLDERAEIMPFARTHTPNTNRTKKTDEYDLGLGALLNLAVFADQGAPLWGQTYVIAQLIRGVGATGVVLATIVQGCITTEQTLAWPGSPLQNAMESGGYVRTITGTTPALGADISETVPTGAEWQLLLLQAQLTTSATAGNRIPVLQFSPHGLQLAVTAAPTTIGPSAQGTFNWEVSMPLASPVTAGVNIAGIPTELRLGAAGSFFIQTTALAAGDQWGAPRFLLREWLQP